VDLYPIHYLHQILSLTSIWRFATERSSHTPTTERTNQRLNSRVATQTANDQRTKEVKDIKRGQEERPLVPTPPSPHAAVHADEPLVSLVELLFGQDCAFLDLEADFEERWEGVGEVADAEGADQGANVTEFGDGTSHDEGEGPVDGNHADPDELSSFGCEGREVCVFVLDSRS
jgi:hypothetical protein